MDSGAFEKETLYVFDSYKKAMKYQDSLHLYYFGGLLWGSVNPVDGVREVLSITPTDVSLSKDQVTVKNSNPPAKKTQTPTVQRFHRHLASRLPTFCPHSAKKANHPSSPTTRQIIIEEIGVNVQCHGGALVPQLPLHGLDVSAGLHHETSGRMAQIVNRHVATLHARAAKRHREPPMLASDSSHSPSARPKARRER